MKQLRTQDTIGWTSKTSMNKQQLVNNLRSSIEYLEQERLSFGIDGEFRLWPSFEREGDTGYVSPQAPFFGIYALSRAFRGIFSSVNYHMAGDILSHRKLYAPAVSSFYAAAFHQLESFLALRGRVFFALPNLSTEFCLGILKNKKWTFRRYRDSHARRWREILSLPEQERNALPACFENLFRYFYRGKHKERISAYALLKLSPSDRWKYIHGTSYCLEEKLKEFLEQIPRNRHEAIYRSFGSDVEAYDAMMSGDNDYGHGLHLKADAYGQFSTAFLSELCSELRDATKAVTYTPEIRENVGLITNFIPCWYDSPKFDQISHHALRELLLFLTQWLEGEHQTSA